MPYEILSRPPRRLLLWLACFRIIAPAEANQCQLGDRARDLVLYALGELSQPSRNDYIFVLNFRSLNWPPVALEPSMNCCV